MSKVNLKDNIYIEGCSNPKYFYGLEVWLNNHNGEIIYKGKTSEIPEELALEAIPKIFKGTDQEMFQSYYYHDSYSITPQESIQSACPEEYCIIYKEN